MRMLILMFVILMSGCTSLGGNTMTIATEDGGKKEVSIDQIKFVGIEETGLIREGRFKAYLANFPKGLFAEYHPLRFRYNAVAYGKNSGKEYPAQALYAGFAECALRMVVIVEGNPSEPIVGVIATTRLTRMFTLLGEEIAVKTPEKLASDAKYRKETVLASGTEVNRLKGVPVSGEGGLRSEFRSWTAFRAPAFQYAIRTPLPEEVVRGVARQNPEYSFGEKLVGNARFGVTLDWFSTAMGAAFDVVAAAGATDKGWDGGSFVSRYEQGLALQTIAAQYEAALKSGMLCVGPRRVGY